MLQASLCSSGWNIVLHRVSEKVGLFCGKLCYFLMVDKLNIDIDRKANW